MREGNKPSNYETMKNNMASVFLQYDQESMIRKFTLEHDEDYLYIFFTGRKYRICRRTGAVTWSEDAFSTETKADYNEAMTIYDVLCCSRDDCRLSGEWVNIERLSSIRGGTLSKSGGFFADAGKYFDGKAAKLDRACEALQGRKISGGDAACELDLFPFLPLCLRFWESDEEFPPSLQILTDKNILDYMHYETLMFAVSHVIGRLKDLVSGDES